MPKPQYFFKLGAHEFAYFSFTEDTYTAESTFGGVSYTAGSNNSQKTASGQVLVERAPLMVIY